MDKLTGQARADLEKLDNKTLMIVMNIRATKLRQEILWLKALVRNTSVAIGFMESVSILIQLFREVL